VAESSGAGFSLCNVPGCFRVQVGASGGGGRVESAESTLHFVRKCPTPFGAFFALLSSFSTRLFSTKKIEKETGLTRNS